MRKGEAYAPGNVESDALKLPAGSAGLREAILSRGCYSAQENLRIYDKWFAGIRPRDRLIAALDRRFHLGSAVLCDVGCGYGMYLRLGGPGSYGIELEPYCARFAGSLGLEVHARDVVTDDLSDLRPVDAVLCLAVLEHVDAPHVFLRKLHLLLKPEGLLIVETPRKPALEWLERAPLLRHVYQDHGDHVNAFTVSTLRFACERAGFRTLAAAKWSKPLAQRLQPLSPFVGGLFPLSLLANGVVYVGAKVADWQYPPEATRAATLTGRGYTYSGAPFPEQQCKENG